MRHLQIKTIKDRWVRTSPFGFEMTTWILEENLDLETILFVPLCICIWFFVQSEWVSSSWSGEMMNRKPQVDQLKIKNAALMKQQKILEEEIQKLLFRQWRCRQKFGGGKNPELQCLFWLLLENMCIFLIYKKYVETPKHILFTFLLFELEWGCWKNLPRSHKKGSPNVSVNFGCDFRWGKQHIISTPHFWLTFSGDGMIKNPLAFLSALIQVEKSEFTCRQPARWVCGGLWRLFWAIHDAKLWWCVWWAILFTLPGTRWVEGQIWELFGGVVL